MSDYCGFIEFRDERYEATEAIVNYLDESDLRPGTHCVGVYARGPDFSLRFFATFFAEDVAQLNGTSTTVDASDSWLNFFDDTYFVSEGRATCVAFNLTKQMMSIELELRTTNHAGREFLFAGGLRGAIGSGPDWDVEILDQGSG